MSKDIECPYCGCEQEIDHEDGYGYEQEELHQQECPKCGKEFGYYTEIHFSYEVKKVPCFNDGEHEWEPTRTFPPEFTKMRCKHCEIEIEPTEAERKFLGIRSKEEYLKELKDERNKS